MRSSQGPVIISRAVSTPACVTDGLYKFIKEILCIHLKLFNFLIFIYSIYSVDSVAYQWLQWGTGAGGGGGDVQSVVLEGDWRD